MKGVIKMKKFEGRTAIVTGSTRGIGRATAELFASEGANVVIVGMNEELGMEVTDEIQKNDGSAFFQKTDVTSGEDLDTLVHAALDQFGSIDILINNAGIGGSLANMDQITDDEWKQVLATNLTAPFQLMRRVIPLMEENEGGTIVNVASMASTAAGRGGIAYTSAKHGLLGLTRQISLDHGHNGIRINAVLPGPIETRMIQRILEMPQHPLNMKIKMSPSGRPGKPEEVAQAIAFLASDESMFIHGAALAVDGGYTIF
jgi:NAD(P)-dependent dehydrogenase (short-subunit alcohol dehydrogenase family)